MKDAHALEREGAAAAAGLPALLADAETLAASLMAGVHGRRRPGAGETFWQYRDYADHDPASAVDWRQSARSPNRLFVRETEWETAATVRIWCGAGPSQNYTSGDWPTKAHRARVIAVALAVMLTRAGENVGALPPEEPARGGARGVMALAERLVAQVETDELPPLPPPRTTFAVFISDFYTPTEALLAQVAAIAASGVRSCFVALHDPAEETFPFDGRRVFSLPGGESRRFLFGDAAAVQSAYVTRRNAHRGTFSDQCARYGFPLLMHATHQPAAPVLAALHGAIGTGA
jgi:MoxR-like ATPase